MIGKEEPQNLLTVIPFSLKKSHDLKEHSTYWVGKPARDIPEQSVSYLNFQMRQSDSTTQVLLGFEIETEVFQAFPWAVPLLKGFGEMKIPREVLILLRISWKPFVEFLASLRISVGWVAQHAALRFTEAQGKHEARHQETGAAYGDKCRSSDPGGQASVNPCTAGPWC